MIKLLLFVLSGARLGKLFASGGTMLVSLAEYFAITSYRIRSLVSSGVS
ncbi:MAG: hypothetical protein M3Z15_02555 [Pseudomonadota bacterium]|nr:hypothetical protein [Pseudomonadota bacterium]